MAAGVVARQPVGTVLLAAAVQPHGLTPAQGGDKGHRLGRGVVHQAPAHAAGAALDLEALEAAGLVQLGRDAVAGRRGGGSDLDHRVAAGASGVGRDGRSGSTHGGIGGDGGRIAQEQAASAQALRGTVPTLAPGIVRGGIGEGRGVDPGGEVTVGPRTATQVRPGLARPRDTAREQFHHGPDAVGAGADGGIHGDQAHLARGTGDPGLAHAPVGFRRLKQALGDAVLAGDGGEARRGGGIHRAVTFTVPGQVGLVFRRRHCGARRPAHEGAQARHGGVEGEARRHSRIQHHQTRQGIGLVAGIAVGPEGQQALAPTGAAQVAVRGDPVVWL